MNSAKKLLKPEETLDKTREIQEKLQFLENSLQNEEQKLEFEREKLQNPDFRDNLSRNCDDFREKSEKVSAFRSILAGNRVEVSKFLREFNESLAFLTKLKKIDRETAKIENVEALRDNFACERAKKAAIFKETQVFCDDSRKFHFLSPTKGSETAKTKKNPSFFAASCGFSANLSKKLPRHCRNRSEFRVKIAGNPPVPAKHLLRIAEESKVFRDFPRKNTANSLFSFSPSEDSVLFP